LGAPGAENDKGTVFVYSGCTGSLRFTHTGTNQSELGGAVAGLGDLNGDGIPDYAAGAKFSRVGGADRGAVYLYSGRSGRLLYRFLGETKGDIFGRSVAAAGDVNQDGLSDLLVGASSKETALGKDIGGAYLFAGNDLFLQASLPEVAEGATLSLFTRGGEPGATYFLSIFEINGIRAPRNLLTAGTLDEFGEAAFEIEVPAGLAGNEFAFKAWSWKTVPQDLPPDRATWSSGPTDPTTVNKQVLIDSGRERVVIE
jgi:hypothetical protein